MRDRLETGYRRGPDTWLVFAGLLAFGFLNAMLGPALPYLRSAEGISYVPASLHQVAFAIGGGMAGLLAARAERHLSRRTTIRAGLLGAALASLGVGYGNRVVVSVAAAFLMSLLATSALIRMWAALADAHGSRRTVAMTEGEVSVSLGGIVAPLVIGALAATALGWRTGFVVGAVATAAAVVAMGSGRLTGSAAAGSAAARSAAAGSTAAGSTAAASAAPGSATSAGRPRRTSPGARRVPRPVSTLVLAFAVVALEFGLSFWLASYLHDSVGISRGLAVLMVSGLYLANLCGRLLASRLARRLGPEPLLAGALLLTLAGLPVLLAAGGVPLAAAGVVLCGVGIGALFPLTSSLHVAASSRSADIAVGQILVSAAIGQLTGPLVAGAIAQAGGLRAGLLVLPALVALAGGALGVLHRAALRRPAPA